MFTGIIQALGSISSTRKVGGDMSMSIDAGNLDLSRTAVGDSIAVNGVCLTVTKVGSGLFSADVSSETLSVTTLGELDRGSDVNLEPALRAGDSLGGHLVTAHIDGIGRLMHRYDDARSVRMEFEPPGDLQRFIAKKGAICVDGVSLTVNESSENLFSVNLVPHTLSCTILDGYKLGTRVNLEVDLLARYMARLLETTGSSAHVAIDEETLRNYGYTSKN